MKFLWLKSGGVSGCGALRKGGENSVGSNIGCVQRKPKMLRGRGEMAAAAKYRRRGGENLWRNQAAHATRRNDGEILNINLRAG